ncbi:MAG: glycosyltransferase family 87 protein [Acidobacteriaceae bacterium]|jgi:hypothetical protein
MENEARETAGEAGRARGRVRLPAELRAFWVASLAVFALAFLVGWLKWRAGLSQYNWDPLSDPLFGDLMEYPGTYKLLHSAAFFFDVAGNPWPYPMFSPVAYPPFAAAVMAPMYAFRVPEVVFLGVSGAWLAALVGWVGRGLVRAGIGLATAVLMPLSLALISFPIERLVHQGNVEVVLWMFTALGVLAFLRGHDDAAAVLWGLAAAMKLFPIVLLILLLPRRKWRAVGVGVGTFAGATLWALWWLGPSIRVAWAGTMQNVFGYQGTRMAEWTLRELVANHSLIEVAKMGAMIAHYPMGRLTLPYFAFGAVVMGAAFFGRLWRMPVANQVLGVSTFMVMFPPISYYHALVHMVAPLLLLGWIAIRAQQAGVRVRGLQGTMLLFVPLFAPFTVLTYPTVFVYCGLMQALVLAVLFLRALEYPFAVGETAARRG